MKKNKTNRKSKSNFGATCLPVDIIDQITTVRTFNKETWINCWDGQFVRMTPDHESVSRAVSLHMIYPSIYTAAKKNKIVAKRLRENQPLRYLEVPQTFGSR